MIRKALLLSFFIVLSVFSLRGQVTVTVLPSDTTVCFNDSMAFRTIITGGGQISYQWQHNNVDVPFPVDTSILIIPHVSVSDTGFYRCIISSGVDRDTSNEAHLRIHPKMNIDTLYRFNELGCPGICKGQFKVQVSGGAPPYLYDWHAGFSQDTLVLGVCPGNHIFTVTDTNNCSLSKNYFMDVLRLPKIDFTITPDKDTIYLGNPNITVQFPDTSQQHIADKNWGWNFGEENDTATKFIGQNPVDHSYTKPGTYTISFSFTDLNGCDTTVQHQITVKVADIQVYNAFTPNSDGKNDAFVIQLKNDKSVDYRTAYLSTELIIFDRWGKKIYNKVDYKSEDWDGGGHSDGVYYYILICHGQYGDEVFKGSVTLIGSKFK